MFKHISGRPSQNRFPCRIPEGGFPHESNNLKKFTKYRKNDCFGSLKKKSVVEMVAV